MIPMIRTLNYDKFRPYILPLLIGLLAFFAGEGIFKVMTERTLGSILRHNIATIAMLFILFAFYNENFIPAIFNFEKITPLSIKQATPLVVFAVAAGIAIFVYGGLGMIYGGIILFIVLCLGLSVFFIFTEKPFYAFCLFWFMYPFLYFIQTQGGSMGFERPVIFDDLVVPFSSVYIVILFCCVILANLTKRPLFDSNLRFIGWFILLSVPSLFFSQNLMKSSAYFAFDIITPVMYLIFTLNAIKTREQIGRAVPIILFSLIIFIFFTSYFFMKGEHEGTGLGLYKSEGAMIPFGTLATCAVIMFPFSFTLYKITHKKIYLFLLGIFAILGILSDVRSVAVAFLSVIVLMFIFSKMDAPKKLFTAMVILLCLFGLFFLSHVLEVGVEIRHRLFSTFSQWRAGVDINEISSGRWEIWESAIRMIKDHPIMGIGAGMWQNYAFLYGSKEYIAPFREGYRSFSYYSVDAHNFFLDLYLKYGILPLLLFSYFLFNILKKCFRAYKKETDSDKKRFIMASYISLLGWLVMSIFSYRFYSYQVGTLLSGIFFWTLMAFVFKSIETPEKSEKDIENI